MALGLCLPKDRRLFIFGGRQYGGNTAPLFERCAEKGLSGVWLTTNARILAEGRPGVVDARSLGGLWLAARARGVVLTHSLGDFAPARFSSRRTLILNVWHGMPLKRISTADPRFKTRSYARSNLREMGRFAAMFATSTEMARLFAETFHLTADKVHITGQPRTDILFAAEAPDPDVRFEPPLPPHTKRVLYCPTWREGTPVRLFPFPDRDLEALQALLEAEDAVLYVRTHPNDPGGLKARDRRIVPLQGDKVTEITDVLPRFDALVTDYSSVWYDYLLLDRPTIFLPYDLAEYAEAPGFYLPFEQIAAGPCVFDQAGFVAALRQALHEPRAFAAERARVSALVYDHVDGGATARVLQVIADLA